MNKDFTSEETIWYSIGILIVPIFYIKSLVLDTVYSEMLRGDLSFDKYLARWYVAAPISEINRQISNFLTLSSLETWSFEACNALKLECVEAFCYSLYK